MSEEFDVGTTYAGVGVGRFGGLQALQESPFLVVVAGVAGNHHQNIEISHS